MFSSKKAFSVKVIVIYRIFALLILSIPIAVNIINNGEIVSSIVYVPMITLGLSLIAIYIDGKLEGLLNRDMVLAKLAVPTTSIRISKISDKYKWGAQRSIIN
jgi:hypothetical protein